MTRKDESLGYEHEEQWLTNKDGLKIYTQVWLPRSEPKANLIIAHGLGDHSGRYGHVAEYFVEKGLAVFALDHQGHGKSEGKRGHINSFSDFTDDLEQFRWQVTERSAEKRTLLFGHSMGGVIVMSYLLDYQHYIDAAVISGPPIGIKMGPPTFIKEIVLQLAKISPSLTVKNGIKPAWISHDKNVVTAYKTDPLTHPHISLSLFSGMYTAGKHIAAHAEKISIPIFMLYGSSDKIIEGAIIDAVFDKLSSEDKKKMVFQNDYHEVHNEADQLDEFDAVWAWLKTKW